MFESRNELPAASLQPGADRGRSRDQRFAIGMLLLGLSGLWMWARGRGMREMAFSVMGLSTLAFAAALALALL